MSGLHVADIGAHVSVELGQSLATVFVDSGADAHTAERGDQSNQDYQSRHFQHTEIGQVVNR